MAIKQCPKCSVEFNGSRALKEHMTEAHGGFTSAEIPSDTGNQAREIMGSSSLSELASKAPSDDSGDGNGTGNDSGRDTSSNSAGTPQKGRPKKGSEEAKQLERKKIAMQRIGGVICRKAASLPYAFWAAMAAQDSLRLTKDEQKELADAYLEIAQGYDMDFSSPFMGIMAAMAINAEFVAKRMGIDLETTSD